MHYLFMISKRGSTSKHTDYLSASRNLTLTGWLWLLLAIWPSLILNLSSMWPWWHHWERNKVVKLTTPQNLQSVLTHWWHQKHRYIRVKPHVQQRGARLTTARIGWCTWYRRVQVASRGDFSEKGSVSVASRDTDGRSTSCVPRSLFRKRYCISCVPRFRGSEY
jgi:hypothetical protein